jgi:hypothetical protein
MSLIAVHRYFNEGHKDHFYTTDVNEIGTTHVGEAGKFGYKYESVAFTVFSQPANGLDPFYRYFSEATHDHFYTANAGEIGKTHVGEVGNHGYKCEGILGYISKTQFPGAVPVYRYWQGQEHNHFYTTKADEIGTTHVGETGKFGYKSEGIAGYAYPAQHNLVPIYRYWHAANTDHFYTEKAAEIGTTNVGQAGNHGYVSEGIAFHVFAHNHNGLVPVYRYWSAAAKNHFYTTNVDEIGTTHVGQAGKHGYVYEGVIGHVSPNPFPGGIPIYRYNKDDSDHFYTTNAGEIGKTHQGEVGNHGYKVEGILGYVPH